MLGKRSLLFISLLIVFCQGTEAGDDSEKSEELSSEVRNQTQEEGPPDSHEAMNNRENSRRKRSYEFLMGLVKRNSTLLQIGRDGQERQINKADNVDFKATESLLELLVKIAADPQQWARVHQMLQQVDKDLAKSKEIIEKVKSSLPESNGGNLFAADTTSKSSTEKSAWQTSSTLRPAKSSYQKNFAYHRVTGKPNSSKNPKAYIAVSVMAPKGPSTDDDLVNELKELKPWTHQQNLKNMADMRAKWVIQNDKETLYAP